MTKKCTKWPQNIPQGRKNRPDDHTIYQHLPLQDPPKFTKIGIFGFENIPSGNLGWGANPDFHLFSQLSTAAVPQRLGEPNICNTASSLMRFLSKSTFSTLQKRSNLPNT
jgi:hypothetical protein